MASSQDTEITLGTGKLLVLFFGLVGICALFFALGYSLGRKAEPAASAASAASPQVSSNANKASGGAAANPQMTFYKSVEGKDTNAELTPPAAPAASARLSVRRPRRRRCPADNCRDRDRRNRRGRAPRGSSSP